MITSGLPALSIGMESPSEIEMHRKPRQRDESIFDRRSVFLIVTNGILFAILSLIAFLIGDRQSVGLAGTMAFAVLAFSQLMASVSMRSERSFFHLKGRRFHPYFLAAFLLSVVLVVAVLTIPPLMRLFRLSAMSGSSWLTVIGLSLIPFVIWEAVKAVKLFIKKK